MKTLTVEIMDTSGNMVAWCRMSATGRFSSAVPETGGPAAATLVLPDSPADLATLGCQCAAAAAAAGFSCRRKWDGRWDLEPSTPEDRDQP